MSLSFADSSYINAISQWLVDHQWVGSGQQQSVLVVQVDDVTRQYHVQSGVGDLRVGASYTAGVDQLDNLTFSLIVPDFGLVPLVEESTYPLSADPGQNLTVSIAGGAITGNVSFNYVGDGNDAEVFINYFLEVPYSENLEDSTSIFPVDIQRVKTIDSSQSSNVKRSEGNDHTRLRVRASDQDQLLAGFLSDHSRNDTILIDTYNPNTTSQKEVAVCISFLAFNLGGSIDPQRTCATILYVRIPIIGRVRIARLNGDLSSGVTATINAIIAKGTVTLTLNDNGKDIYANININVIVLGNISQKVPIFTLPF